MKVYRGTGALQGEIGGTESSGHRAIESLKETIRYAIMHLTQILTPRRQGAKESIGFELLPSPLAGEGRGVRGCRQSLGQVHNPEIICPIRPIRPICLTEIW